MMDCQSNSRKRMDNQSSCDLLSDLPLSIIHIILARVPIRDAVRTCILSKQWRYTWASLPRLVFNNLRMMSSKDDTSCEFSKKNFVTQALSLHKGPIHTVKLYASYLNTCPETDQWLLSMSSKDIRELRLFNKEDSDDNWFELHSSIYSCQNLSKLELFSCELPQQPPNFKGFLCLRHLNLQNVWTPSVESLVANSPLLEKLILGEHASSELRISAPNLKCFGLTGDYKEISLYAPLLCELSVTLYEDFFTAEYLQHDISVCNYIKFFGGFTNLQKLKAHFFFTKYISIGIESCHHSLVFQHLKTIHLYEVNFQDRKERSVVVRLIEGAPNLHKLGIITVSLEDAPETRDGFCWDTEFTPDITFEKLRVVKMPYAQGHLQEMKFIKFLLNRSPVLETMRIGYSPEFVDDGIQRLMTDLLGYRRASPNAAILFKPSSI